MTRIENMGGAHGSSAYGAAGGFGATYYAYDPNGNVTYKRLANNTFTYFTYDAANRVTSILNCLPDGAPLAYFLYDYDAASRITSITREDGKVIYYTYDDADRLTSETWNAADHTNIYAFEWDYDGAGNRTYQKRGSVETYYTYDAANQLTLRHEIPGHAWTYFSYDSRGNCTHKEEPDGTTYFRVQPREPRHCDPLQDWRVQLLLV